MYLDKNAILNSLTKEDVIKIVTALGSNNPRKDSNGNLIFQTICHNPPNENNSYKLYYYHDSSDGHKGKIFHCYSGCQESFSIVELVIRANRANGKTVTWYRALKFIGQITGKLITVENDVNTEVAEQPNDMVWLNRLIAAKKKWSRSVSTLSEINENVLDLFYYAPHEEWLNDHITREALSRFEIGYYGLTNQITIPHRDKDNRLIGVRGRFLDEEDVKNIGKYVPMQINGEVLKHSLGSNLYGINITQDKIKQCKKVMLVESEKGCMQAYSYFEEDSFVVACCGANITNTQIKIILEYLQVGEVIVAFDRMYHSADSFEAEIYYNKLIKKIAPLVPYCNVYLILDTKDRIPYKASPTDMGKEVLLELMSEKHLVTAEEVDEVMGKKYE